MVKRCAKYSLCFVALVLAAAGCRDLVSNPTDAGSVSTPAPEQVPAPRAEAAPVRLPALVWGREHALLHEWLRSSAGMQVEDHRHGEPLPIPGGIQIPGGPLLHTFLPGPPSAMGMGEDVEPGVITNFKGFVAQAYLVGQATDATGHAFDMSNDIRVMSGDYRSADGRRHHGTFGFV